MGKLLLSSILVATFVVPMIAARDADPRRGYRRLVLAFAAFDVGYLLAVIYLYPRLG